MSNEEKNESNGIKVNVLIYIIPYLILLYTVISLASNKSALDSAIVIISLFSMIISNLKNVFPKIQSLLDRFTNSTFHHVQIMFFIVSVLGVVVVSLIPFFITKIEVGNYYTSKQFFTLLVYSILPLIPCLTLFFLDEKYENNASLKYAIFWFFLLVLYVASIFISYFQISLF